ncbi:hypothetical protein CPB85DRAFT_1318514 [Mucidula mucida]|nr:hypothetical protein CPB85DRAFT_1318410 [Mucidula mucida]KAF8904183.1 hypothetical protein CPB85DRAFT_1318514 [Mucidula mucida]
MHGTPPSMLYGPQSISLSKNLSAASMPYLLHGGHHGADHRSRAGRESRLIQECWCCTEPKLYTARHFGADSNV